MFFPTMKEFFKMLIFIFKQSNLKIKWVSVEPLKSLFYKF